MIDTLYYKNHNLQELDYLIGGQVCIEKNFRGKGLFYKLYNYAQQSYKSSYPLMLTEVSDRNPRSVKAHLNCGFEIIHSYQMTDQESWSILAWNWNLAD